MNVRAARRYAQALLEVAEEHTSLDRFNDDMRSIAETLRASRELRALLRNPVVKHDAKLRILTEIFSKQVTPSVMIFITLLVKKGRSGLLGDTASEFTRLLEAKRGIINAHISSAVQLGADEERLISQKLEAMLNHSVASTFSVDPSIVGGFVARIGDTLIDASLKHQLELLREQFRHGGAHQLN